MCVGPEDIGSPKSSVQKGKVRKGKDLLVPTPASTHKPKDRHPTSLSGSSLSDSPSVGLPHSTKGQSSESLDLSVPNSGTLQTLGQTEMLTASEDIFT